MNKYLATTAIALSLTGFQYANATEAHAAKEAVIAESMIENQQAVSTQDTKKTSSTETYMYMCNLGAVVTAVYDAENENAKLDVHAPIWQLNNQTLTMQLSPSASGSLYTNGKYQWHTKDDMGVLSMKGSTVGDIKCEGNAISFL